MPSLPQSPQSVKMKTIKAPVQKKPATVKPACFTFNDHQAIKAISKQKLTTKEARQQKQMIKSQLQQRIRSRMLAKGQLPPHPTAEEIDLVNRIQAGVMAQEAMLLASPPPIHPKYISPPPSPPMPMRSAARRRTSNPTSNSHYQPPCPLTNHQMRLKGLDPFLPQQAFFDASYLGASVYPLIDPSAAYQLLDPSSYQMLNSSAPLNLDFSPYSALSSPYQMLEAASPVEAINPCIFSSPPSMSPHLGSSLFPPPTAPLYEDLYPLQFYDANCYQ